MKRPSAGLMRPWVLLTLLSIVATESSASNGVKSPAVGGRSYGRAGTGIAFADDATSMHVNPAHIMRIGDESVTITPSLMQMTAVYEDRRNDATYSRLDSGPFLNSGFVFDFHRTRDERLEEGGEDPYGTALSLAPGPAPAWTGSPLKRSCRFAVAKLPARLEILARGRGTISQIKVMAKYEMKPGEEPYLKILGTHESPVEAGAEFVPVAAFEGMENPFRRDPFEISLHFTALPKLSSMSDELDVLVRADGREVGGVRITAEDLPATSRLAAPGTPEAIPSVSGLRGQDDEEIFKFGLGQIVMTGAGADYTLATEMYPEGARHFATMTMVGVVPTLGVRLSETISAGASIQFTAGELEMNAPHTQTVDVLQGALFPADSLDAALGGDFGLPNQFGPALKSVMASSATHAPGTSTTHTQKGYDEDFSRITGMTRLKGVTSTGVAGRLGLLWDAAPGWGFGMTYQSKTRQRSYVGKARVDFNRQIQAFSSNPTVGHTNEISILGVPNEMRFTFDDVWNRGVVDVYVNNGTLILNDFALPSGPVKNALPNQGRNGYAANYDVIIDDFNLPQELGFGLVRQISPDLKFMFDVKRIFWSETHDTMTMQLINGDNPDVNAMVGSPSVSSTVPLHWEDQDVYGLGLEYEAASWLTLRSGYNYGTNPIPEETMTWAFPATTEHHVAFGFTLHGNEFDIDFGFMRALAKTVSVTESEVAPDLEGSEHTVAQDFYVVGISYSF